MYRKCYTVEECLCPRKNVAWEQNLNSILSAPVTATTSPTPIPDFSRRVAGGMGHERAELSDKAKPSPRKRKEKRSALDEMIFLFLLQTVFNIMLQE